MKVDTLKLRIETIKNAKTAAKDICREYGQHFSDSGIQYDDTYIIVTILGKAIQIPYYYINYGEQVDVFEQIYESVEVDSLSIEKVKEIIIEEFTFECKLKNE
ncbi:hypothetical protein [Clostridium sp. BL-8]|uniref:hypothetical protein n=1 Tax=Clostridium sp. BL-8 TaxID=349938 RepID=UPI00098C91E9|nr:hypothetical protein [Clostridium sp. BL-8]OOM76591.1 hypothetical protein CLOBL_34760 [Clostridium sp. BL-8]